MEDQVTPSDNARRYITISWRLGHTFWLWKIAYLPCLSNMGDLYIKILNTGISKKINYARCTAGITGLYFWKLLLDVLHCFLQLKLDYRGV